MLKKRTKTAKKPVVTQVKNKKFGDKRIKGPSFRNKKEFDSDSNGGGSDDESSFHGQNQGNEATKWYEEFTVNETESTSLDDAVCTALRKEAGAIFEQEVANNSGKAPKTIPKSDYAWIKTVISKGTINDKIAAYVLLIQDNPVVNMGYLKTMVSMTKVGKKREFFMTMDTLVELFVEDLLPPNRKLKFFSQQPLSLITKITSGDKNSRQRLLLIWFYEDQLKNMYTTFLRAVNEAAHDSVDTNKERAIVTMQKLLQGHPEQESTLLANIVNKLGDPSHKIGSKVIYSLTQLLDKHPAMKGVVAEEVEKVIFRPNMSKRAQYYSVCFLSQFTFDSQDSALANHLITIYFSLFKACIKTGEIDSRMMKALLTGVSRAYPFAKSECSILSEHINTVYKVVHLSCANVAIHALSLLYLVAGDSLTDRFMTVLYKKLGETAMFNAAHHAMFLSIIFKAVKRDTSDGRVCAFIRRLLQVAVLLPVSLSCGILILVSQIVHSRKKFELRLEQDAVPEVAIKVDDDDEDEHYRDCPVEEATPEVKDENEVEIKKEPGTSSWYHAAHKATQNQPRMDAYDPYQRNPFHANGDKSMPCELLVLARHYHPTVALFASNILQGLKVNYSGDPLQDFTLIRFLDKFVFKNPKKITPAEERVSTFARFGRKKYYSSVGLKALRVNTNDYLNNDEKSIPVDETFMYKYLKEKSQSKPGKIKKEDDDDDDSDAESLDDDEFDDILSKVSKGGKDDLDFMNEIGSLPTEKLTKDDSEDDDEAGSSEGEDDLGDEEGDSDFNDLPEDDDGAEDLSDLDSNAEDFDGDEADDWSDDAELDSDLDETPPPKSKNSNKTGKKPKGGGLFASAEEFSELLEKDQYQAGRSSTLSNKDNAAGKQLKWEMNRDHWLKGGKNTKRFKKGPQGGMKRKGKNNSSRPVKKIRK